MLVILPKSITLDQIDGLPNPPDVFPGTITSAFATLNAAVTAKTRHTNLDIAFLVRNWLELICWELCDPYAVVVGSHWRPQ